jgi:hypothetical protein
MTRTSGWRPLILVPLAVVAFAALVEPAGLIVATAVMVLLATGAGPATWRARVTSAIVLAVLAALLFVAILDQPIPLLPGR